MASYIVLHKPSQLIKTVITASEPPTPDDHHSVHIASSAVLDRYYRLLTKARRNGVLVSVGDLAAVSPSFKDSLVEKHLK